MPAGTPSFHLGFSIDDSLSPAGDINHISGNFYQWNQRFSNQQHGATG
ncbi:hypothetical protein DDI_2727 [Dickeya dianthicola RNS04.9]|nr:hypothetical protein DDI_2727 [Dickeya dianthicola RNS04.9]